MCFNSQASYEARRSGSDTTESLFAFQFTGLIRGPTLPLHSRYYRPSVSIHRPHTRPDETTATQAATCTTFQFTGLIRGPTPHSFGYLFNRKFQFTGLIRGPTAWAIDLLATLESFNSQASYEARRESQSRRKNISKVSIHRPHTRPDVSVQNGRTDNGVSIHRPHTRPDHGGGFRSGIVLCFNSQASYEARRSIRSMPFR